MPHFPSLGYFFFSHSVVIGPIPLPLRATPWIHFLPFLNPFSRFSTLCLLEALLAVLRWPAHLHKLPTMSPKGAPAPLALWMCPLFYTPVFYSSMVYAPESIPKQTCPLSTHHLPPTTGPECRLHFHRITEKAWDGHPQLADVNGITAHKWLQLHYFYTPVSHSIIKYLLSAHNVRDTFWGSEEEVRIIPIWTLAFWSLHSCALERPSCPVWSESSHFLTECVPLTVRVTSVSCDAVSHLMVSVICLHSPHRLHPSYTGVHTQVHTCAHRQGIGCLFPVNCTQFGRITLWILRGKGRRKGGREREKEPSQTGASASSKNFTFRRLSTMQTWQSPAECGFVDFGKYVPFFPSVMQDDTGVGCHPILSVLVHRQWHPW